MRTIERDIVGAFIFSQQGEILLGHNKEGGVYPGKLVIPGGGIKEGETELGALRREVMEEVGVDISDASISPIGEITTGEHEKVLRATGERVFVLMRFHDFEVRLPRNSSEITLRFDDDFADATWYKAEDLEPGLIGPATLPTLQKLHLI